MRGDSGLERGVWGISRRACLIAAAAPAGWLAAPGQAHAGGQLEEPLMDSVRTALSSAHRQPGTARARVLLYRVSPELPALAGHYERPAAQPQARLGSAPRFSADGLVRVQACRAGRVPCDGADPGGKRVPQVCGLQRGCAGLHAGHALLDPCDWRWGPWESSSTCRPICALAA